ncbi:unnamed protein product [Phytophthora fragariaefolia]|uniref:Unnamed protein product n=1 Tax=Phytophthora fragariaefolia TaxID=1490495 RepID=A0A9W6Y934_9STRA|nr:unnamed protein product [Phytophthora fragariaefolia]
MLLTTTFTTTPDMRSMWQCDGALNDVDTSQATGGYVLAEGNNFDCVKTSNLPDPEGNIFIPTAAGDYQSTIGRNCEVNVLVVSGAFTSNSEDAAKAQLEAYEKQISATKVTAASKLSAATGNFGVGELESSSVAPAATSSSDSSTSQASTAPATTDTPQQDQVATEPPSTPAPAAPTAQSAATAAQTPSTNAPVATEGTSPDMPLGTVAPYADNSAAESSVLEWGDVMQGAASSRSG